MIDLAAEVRAALAAEGLTGAQFDERIERAVTRALERRDVNRWLGQAELARHLGLTPKALSARLSRGSSLAALAVVDDAGRRRWRRADVDGWLETNRTHRKST